MYFLLWLFCYVVRWLRYNYTSWVWSFVLRYPFFKALLSHTLTDAMFQSIYLSFLISWSLFSVLAFCYVVLWLRHVPVGCEALCWGIPSLRHCLVILQQMQCSKVFIIPNFINIIFCFCFLLWCTVIEACASWVWSFMLRNPFFKALLCHITTDAMFQSIFRSYFHNCYFLLLAFSCVVLWLWHVPVGCEALCWGIPSL